MSARRSAHGDQLRRISIMRSRFLALVLPAVLLPLAAGAQVRDSVITVTTSRTTRLTPDRALFFAIVEGVAETPADAIGRVDTKVKAVTDALKAIGSSVDVDRPVTVSIGPVQTNNGYPSTPTPPTNIARVAIRVQVGRVDQVSRVVAAALTAGAASTSSPTFESSVADSVRRARIADALAGAKADAQAIATSLDGHVGALVDISSNAGNNFVNPTVLYLDNRYSPQSMAPEVVVTSAVTVRYRLVR
jgi:uncharacterized protein YggE